MEGNTLKIIREYYRISQRKMATKVGVNYSYISLLERNIRPWTIPILTKYSLALGIPVSHLILMDETLNSDGKVNLNFKKCQEIIDWSKMDIKNGK